jgi:heme A synthase
MGRLRVERARRPFWLHQIVEYLLGIVLVSLGLQSPTPVLPATAGALVLLNASVAIGPASAFRLVGRTLHRSLDLAVLAIIVTLALQPWVNVESGTRGMMLLVAFVLAVVWFYTDFAERTERRQRRLDQARPRSDDIGRGAGRMAGNLVNQWRRRNG